MLTPMIASIALTGIGFAQEPPAGTAAEQSVEELTDFICATDDETRWLNIPWRVSFWQSVIDAQSQRKPILLWAMNGHPLGCT